MTVVTETPNTKPAAVRDRRRPGRPENVSPELIPLLRASERAKLPNPDQHNDDEFDANDDDQLSASRGIAAAVAFSVPFWIGIACMVRFVLG